MLFACRSKKPVPRPPEPVQVTLVAVGDLLMHQDVQKSARNAGGFDALWADVTPLFSSADIAFANLETPVAPRCGRPGRPFIFNAPADLTGAMKRSGLAVLSTANNHAYDQDRPGVIETLERLEGEGLTAVGSGRDQASAEAPHILVRKGMRIAFLGYTDIFNTDLNVEGKGPWVNPLDEDRAADTIRAVRPQVDAVVVSIHWGSEYQHNPSERQREVAGKLFDAGADLIIGHHPHVLQPLETSDCAGRPVAVAYSLGNFISNQDRTYHPELPVKEGDSRDGMALMATFVMRVELSGARHVTLASARYIPLWTLNNWQEVQTGKARTRDIRVMRTEHLQEERLHALRQERVRSIVGDKLEPASSQAR